MAGRVVHFEIPFDDAARAKAFYSQVLGWEVQDIPELDYTSVSTGPTGPDGPTEPGFINGGMFERSDSFSRTPTLVIDVDDIDATLAAVEEQGGRTVNAKAPVGDMGFAAYFEDPEGNVIGLWQNA